MRKHEFLFISFLFATLVLFSATAARPQQTPPLTQPAPDSEIDKIIRDVSIDSQKGAISNYTYMMKFSYERHKKFAGRKFSRLYEVILPARFSTRRIYRHQILLIEDSERAISNEEILSARQQLARELEKAENEADATSTPEDHIEDGGYWTTGFSGDGKRVKISILQLLQNSNLSNLERKKINGRDFVTIDFTPKSDAAPEKNLAYLAKMEGRIVIDEADRRIVRVEGFALGTFAGLKDKSDEERQAEMVFLFAQTKVYEGFWFPQTIHLNFAKHPEMFDPIEIEFDFSSYKKADVNVQDAIEAPKEKPEPAPADPVKTDDSKDGPGAAKDKTEPAKDKTADSKTRTETKINR